MNDMNVTGIDPAVDRFVFVHGPTAKTRLRSSRAIDDSLDRSPSI